MFSKKKFIYLTLYFLIIITTIFSVAYFKFTESNADNYIHIGKIPPKESPITGSVFEYSKTRKDYYTSYGDWKYDIAINAIDAIRDTTNALNPMNLKHDLNTVMSSDKSAYFALFTMKDFKSGNVISTKRITLNIEYGGKTKVYNFETLKPYLKILYYDSGRDKFFAFKSNTASGSVIMIDLHKLLEDVSDVQSAKITLNSPQGAAIAELSTHFKSKHRLTGTIYTYNTKDKGQYSNYNKWLHSIGLSIMKQHYEYETIYDLETEAFTDSDKNNVHCLAILQGAHFADENDFDKKYLSLELKTEDSYNYYNYNNLKNKSLSYYLDVANDDFILITQDQDVSAVVIDITSILNSVKSKKSVTLKLNTRYNDFILNIR